VGFYAKYVLPRVIDLAMRNEETTRLRAAWIPLARGDVLEVGIGSGLNLPFYSSDVQRVYGVDPSIELQQMARKRTMGEPIEVEFLSQSAEEPLPLADASIDTVVMTWTLCSIPNAAKALQQDEARSQRERARHLSGAWPRSRSWRGCLAGPDHAALEADLRRLPPES
jgi:SAM-dependent methyltransferase